MNCTKCNFEMEEELLYCPSCGHEIQLVPEYKIEEVDKVLETISLEESDTYDMSKFKIEDQLDTILESDISEEDLGILHNRSRVSKFIESHQVLVFGFILIVLGGLFTNVILITTRNNSYEYQVDKAVRYIEQKEYERAITNLERAISIDSKDPKAKLLIANTYCALEQEDVAIMLLLDTIRNGVELVEVYTALIRIYEQNGDYELIHDLLEQSTDMTMKQNFQQYVADVPDFSIDGGRFDEVVPLKLLSNVSGTIYYTINGSNPTVEDAIYEFPIFLEEGTFEVRACYENEFGVMSGVVSQTYIIEIETVAAP